MWACFLRGNPTRPSDNSLFIELQSFQYMQLTLFFEGEIHVWQTGSDKDIANVHPFAPFCKVWVVYQGGVQLKLFLFCKLGKITGASNCNTRVLQRYNFIRHRMTCGILSYIAAFPNLNFIRSASVSARNKTCPSNMVWNRNINKFPVTITVYEFEHKYI